MLLSFFRQRFVYKSNSKLKICASFSSRGFSELKGKDLTRILKMKSDGQEWLKISNNHNLLSTIASQLLKEEHFKDLDQLVGKVGLSKCSTGLQTTLLKSYLEREDWNKAQDLYSVGFLSCFVISFLFIMFRIVF